MAKLGFEVVATAQDNGAVVHTIRDALSQRPATMVERVLWRQMEDLHTRLGDALFTLGMVDKNNRIDAGEKGKAWNGQFVANEVRRVIGEAAK